MRRRVVEKCHDVLREAYCGDTFGVDSLASKVCTNGRDVSAGVVMQVTLEEVWEHECGSRE
jgi:hypothetical protein